MQRRGRLRVADQFPQTYGIRFSVPASAASVRLRLSLLSLLAHCPAAETGVVSWLSKFVAEKKISLLYLSTFPSAFIMVRIAHTHLHTHLTRLQVQEKNVNAAVAALREGAMDVLSEA